MTLKINSTILDAVNFLNKKKLRTLFIIDKNQKVIGSFSLGDFKSCIDKGVSLDSNVSKGMNKNFKYVIKPVLRSEIIEIFQRNLKITDLVVLDKSHKLIKVLKRDEYIKNKNTKIPLVIMAGGRGTRLLPVTEIIPKALMPVKDVPLSVKILENFYIQKIRNFFIIINSNKNLIKAYFKNLKKYQVKFIEENDFLGTAGSLYYLRKKISKDFFLTNCDLLLNCNYEELLDFHLNKKNLITIVAAFKSYQYPYGVCIIKKDDVLKDLKEKPTSHKLTSIGFYIINPRVLKLVKKNEKIDMDQLIKRVLSKNKNRIRVYPVQEDSWQDYGNWASYNKNINL